MIICVSYNFQSEEDVAISLPKHPVYLWNNPASHPVKASSASVELGLLKRAHVFAISSIKYIILIHVLADLYGSRDGSLPSINGIHWKSNHGVMKFLDYFTFAIFSLF